MRERLVRLRQYHDAHTVHKVLSKLQPVEEEAFLAAYNAQVGWTGLGMYRHSPTTGGSHSLSLHAYYSSIIDLSLSH